jgi:hypothetical protein
MTSRLIWKLTTDVSLELPDCLWPRAPDDLDPAGIPDPNAPAEPPWKLVEKVVTGQGDGE